MYVQFQTSRLTCIYRPTVINNVPNMKDESSKKRFIKAAGCVAFLKIIVGRILLGSWNPSLMSWFIVICAASMLRTPPYCATATSSIALGQHGTVSRQRSWYTNKTLKKENILQLTYTCHTNTLPMYLPLYYILYWQCIISLCCTNFSTLYCVYWQLVCVVPALNFRYSDNTLSIDPFANFWCASAIACCFNHYLRHIVHVDG